MEFAFKKEEIFLRHIALPQDHGSWVFLLSPLLIGLFAGGSWRLASGFLILGALAAFLIRQPVTIAIKAYSGRRARRDLPAARFWMVVYGLLGLVALGGLVLQGYAYLLVLTLPGLPVFTWHLYLVSKRQERRKMGIELLGTGVLALAAPAGFWVARGFLDPTGWWLFALTWFQSAASIVYAYMRLEQRSLKTMPDLAARLHMGWRAVLYATFNLLAVLVCALLGILPLGLLVPYGLQFSETLYGTLRPALGVKPTAIGMRQLIVSSLFTLTFILTWNL